MSKPLFPDYVDAPSYLGREKQQTVSELRDQKIREMNGGLTPAEELLRDLQEIRRREEKRDLNRQRTNSELLDDAHGLMANTVDSIGTGSAAALSQVSPVMGAGVATLSQTPIDQILETGDFSRAVSEDLLSKAAARIEARNAERSVTGLLNEAQVQRTLARRQAENQQAYQDAVDQGGNATQLAHVREARNFGAGLEETLNNPTALFDQTVASIPTLAAGPLGRVAAGARASQIGASAAARAQLQREAMMAGVGLTEGSSQITDTANEILQMPLEDLIERFPNAGQALRAGANEADVRYELARTSAGTAAGLTTVLTAGAAALSARFNLDPTGLAPRVSGKAARKAVSEPLQNVAQEFVEEGVQSGAGAFAGNVGRRVAGEENVDLMEGVGVQAGQGAASGLSLAAHMQAPAMGVAVIKGTAEAAKDGGVVLAKRLKAGIEARSETVRTALSEENMGKIREFAATQYESARNLAAKFAPPATDADDATASDAAAAGTPAQPATTQLSEPAANDPILAADENTPTQFENQSRLEGMVTALVELGTANPTPERKLDLQTFIAKNYREGMLAASQMEEGSEAREELEAFLGQSSFQSLADGLHESVGPEMFQKLVETLPADVVETTPEARKQTAEIMEFLRQAPDLIQTTEQADKVLAQNLEPKDRTLVESIKQQLEAGTEYETERQEIVKKTGTYKSQNIVHQDVVGPAGKGKAKSLSAHNRDVRAAMAKGDIEGARKALVAMHKFARDHVVKAKTFDSYVLRAIEQKLPQIETTYRTRKERWKDPKVPENYVLYMDKPGSLGIADMVHAEAAVAAKYYNAVANSFPELIQNTEGLSLQLPVVGKPSFRNVLGKNDAPALARTVRLNKFYKRHQGRRQNMQLVQKDGLWSFEPTGPMAADQKLPTVTNPQGKVLSQAQVESILSHNMSAETAAAQPATAPVNPAPAPEAEVMGLEEQLDEARQDLAALIKRGPPKAQLDTNDDGSEGDGFREYQLQVEELRAEIDSLAREIDSQNSTQDSAEDGEDTVADGRRQASGQRTGAEPAEGEDTNNNNIPTEPTDPDETARQQILAEAQAVLAEGRGEVTAPTVDTRTLEDLRRMTEDQYISAVNPEGKVLTEEEAQVLTAMNGIDLPEGAVEVGSITDKNGTEVSVYRDDDGNRYAVENDTVLGAVINQDGATLNHVLPGSQGRGIGRQLLVEYLREFPFAKSGGFTEAGERARRAAFRILKNEDKPASRALDARFPELPQRMDGQPGQAEGVSRNRLLSAFQPAPGSTGLLARFNSLREAVAALLRDNDGIKELLPPGMRHLQVQGERREALREVFDILVPAFNEALQARLDDRIQNHSFLRQLIEEPEKQVWQYANRASVHAMAYGKDAEGKYWARYQPQVAEAMALAALEWLIDGATTAPNFNREDAAKAYGENMPEALLGALQNEHMFQSPAENIASLIPSILGIKARDDQPSNHNQDLMRALSLDALNVLGDMGLLQMREVATGLKTDAPAGKEPQDITLTFLSPVPGKKQELKDLREKMGGGSLLRTLLRGKDDVLPQVGGTPPTDVPQRVRNSFLNTSKAQQEALKKAQSIPFRRNGFLFDLFTKLEGATPLMLGYNPDTGQMVPGHRDSVQGQNESLLRALQLSEETDRLIHERGQADGIPADEVQTFFHWGIDSNARMRMQGFNPQGDKVARALFTPARQVVDLTNPEIQKDYWLALGQALDINTTKYRNTEVAAKVQALLANQDIVQLAENLAKLQATDNANVQQVTALRKEIQKQYFEVLGKYNLPGGTDSARTINALLDYGRYLQAGDAGRRAHDTTLTVEIDGKTNGPFNAIVQFGLKHVGPGLLKQLEKTGLFVNKERPTVLSDMGEALGDLYTDTGTGLEESIKRTLADPEMPEAARKAYGATLHLLRQGGLIDFVTTPEGVEVKVKRAMGKGPLMTTPYGSGERTVVAALVYKLIDHINEVASEAARNGQPLPQPYRGALQTLLSQRYDRQKETWVARKPWSDLNRKQVFGKNPIHDNDVEILISNIKSRAGNQLNEVVRGQMAGPLETMGQLYMLTGFQWARARKTFNERREARRQELIAEGKMLPRDLLSKSEEQKILHDLRDILPVYRLGMTGGRTDMEGISVLSTERQTISEARAERAATGVGGRVERIGSLFGGAMSLMPSETVMTPPGVSIAALGNISAGDASMIHHMLTDNADVTGTLPVFDGIELALGKVKDWGRKANDAVLKTIQHSMLDSIMETVDEAGLQEMIQGLDYKQGVALGLELRIYSKFKSDDIPSHVEAVHQDLTYALQSLVHELKNNRQLSEHNRKELTERRRFSLDQMSTGENPTTNDVALVADVMEGFNMVGEATTVPDPIRSGLKERQDKIAPLHGALEQTLERRRERDGGVATLDKTDIELMLETLPNVGNDKLARAIYRMIQHRLPEGLTLHYGRVADLQAMQRELYPDGTPPMGNDDAGAFYQNQVFLARPSMESLVHELIHATTYGLLRDAYSPTASKHLTSHQRDAVKQLESLTQAFLEKDFGDLPMPMDSAVTQARAVIRGHWNNGNIPEAVNEYMAWTMTNREIARVLQKTAAPSPLKALAKTVLKFVRQLLGLPNNAPVTTFLEQTVGQMHRLVRRELESDSNGLQMSLPLAQLLSREDAGPDNSAHGHHVTNVLRQFDRMLKTMPQQVNRFEVATDAETTINTAVAVTQAFLNAGFNFTKTEELAFTHIQAAMASVMELDSGVLANFVPLYLRAMKKLSPSDLMENPDSDSDIDNNLAQQRYNALTGLNEMTRTTDARKRSSLMANFVALSQVHAPLRRFLETQAAHDSRALSRYRGKNLDEKLTHGATELMDRLSEMSLEIHDAPNIRSAMDHLTYRLEKEQQRLLARQKTAAEPQLLDRLQQPLKDVMSAGGRRVGQAAERLQAAAQAAPEGKKQAAMKLGGLILYGVQALTDSSDSDKFAEPALSLVNQSGLPMMLREMIADIIGQTTLTRPLIEKINQARQRVSSVRQRIREEGPAELRKLFKQTLSPEQWAMAYRVIGKGDLQALLGGYKAPQLLALTKSQKALEQEIRDREAELRDLGGNEAGADYLSRETENLARYMVTGYNNSLELKRNARALVTLAPMASKFTGKQGEMTKMVDRLVSLKALALADPAEKALLTNLLETEAEGMHRMLMTLHRLNREEYRKHSENGSEYNALKGFLPETRDPRHVIVLANPIEAKRLVLLGYERVRDYHGDPRDKEQGMAYYALRHAGGKTTYTQGALQTVEMTLGSVDALSGRHLGPQLQTMKGTFLGKGSLRAMNKARTGNHNLNLVPVYGLDPEDGAPTIVGYQRPLDPVLLAQHTQGKQDLAQSLGNWFGRQVEEQMAHQFNAGVASVLVDNWEQGQKNGDQAQYIEVNSTKKEIPQSIRAAWTALPRKTKSLLEGQFPDGKVMIRSDMVNNAIGYPQATVADVFQETGNLPASVRTMLRDTAYATLGPKAHKYLVMAERGWQGAVGTAKDWIIVRSLVVPAVNAMANVYQMIQMGVPIKGMLRAQARKVQETRLYLRNQKRQAQILFDMAATTNINERRRLELENQVLEDLNKSMSIAPLIAAGEFPTIAEGLSETDEYTLAGDATRWIEEKVGSLPGPLRTAARYAVVAKDTSLYQGLNRSIQFSDFMAKAVLYDHLTKVKKVPAEKAMAMVSEAFVNYVRTGGRGRDYLESMGGLWFWNYKLRIQKIVLGTLRDNPLRFFLLGTGAEWLGHESLLSSAGWNTNWTYSMGPEMMGTAPELLIWNHMMP